MICSASHKGLMLPPGVAFVTASPKAQAVIAACGTPRYYLDLRACKKAMANCDTPFTPSIGVVIGMAESLRMIKARDLEKMFEEFKRLAQGARAGCKAIGLELFPDAACAGSVLTCVKLPAGIDGEKVIKTMRDTYGITMAGGQDALKGKVVRMAHMGALDEYDVLTGLACLEKVLHQMGHKFELGAGLTAAQKIFNP